MFTGIVQGLIRVKSIRVEDNLKRFSLDMGELSTGIKLGASVAVNGTCLTVTQATGSIVDFDVITETLKTTNLNDVLEGDLVNVERSFQVGDEVGGHIVSGHVTSTACLVDRRVEGHDHVLTFELDRPWMKYVFHKGYVALDGASLTVSSIDRARCRFQVSLIPETLSRTTLGEMPEEGRVNLEVDSQTLTTVETVERLFSDEQWRNQILGVSSHQA